MRLDKNLFLHTCRPFIFSYTFNSSNFLLLFYNKIIPIIVGIDKIKSMEIKRRFCAVSNHTISPLQIRLISRSYTFRFLSTLRKHDVNKITQGQRHVK